MKKMASLLLCSLLLTFGGVGPATAEIVTLPDPEPACSQRPALDVKRVTFNYGDDKFVWTLKMGALNRQRTRVIARYTLGNRFEARYDVMLQTKFDRNGNKRVVGYWSNYVTGDYSNRFSDGLQARWNWERRVIKITLTSHVRGQRAHAWGYSVAKGDLHGPPCGDYIGSGRIDRG